MYDYLRVIYALTFDRHTNSMIRTTGHWMATGKAWGLASSLWEALLAWVAGGGPVEATAPTASTATY